MDSAWKKPGPRQQRAVNTRKKILTAMREFIATDGYERANTNLIAARAGVSVGTVYKYFKDKREMFLEIIEEQLETAYPLIKENLAAAKMKKTFNEGLIKKIIMEIFAVYQNDGNLNFEMDKFVLKDDQGHKLKDHWYSLYRDELAGFLRSFEGKTAIQDFDTAASILIQTGYAVLQFIFLSDEKIDTEAVFSEYIAMVKRYVLK